MKRRHYLGLLGASAGLAGCSGSSPTQEPTNSSTPTPTETTSETETPTATDEPSSFELVSASAPTEAEIGEQISYSFTVRNTGGKAGQFSTLIQTRLAKEEYDEGAEWSDTINPGEELTFESEPFDVNILTTLYIRIGAFDRELQTDIVSRRLPFGRFYTSPDEILLSAYRVEFNDTLAYTSNGYEYELTPDSGNQFLRVYINVENQSGQPYYVSNYTAFAVVSGNSQYDAQFETRIEGYYEGGQIQPGVVRDGWLLFEVPDDLTAEEVTLAWTKQYLDGITSVYWDNSL